MPKAKVPEFSVDSASDVPIWVQIRDRFVYLITSGYYHTDDPLPSVRLFSAENRISPSTVAKSYTALEREGYIVTRHGSGVYVRGIGEHLDLDTIRLMTEEYIKNCQALGMSFEDIPQVVNTTIKQLKDESGQKGAS